MGKIGYGSRKLMLVLWLHADTEPWMRNFAVWYVKFVSSIVGHMLPALQTHFTIHIVIILLRMVCRSMDNTVHLCTHAADKMYSQEYFACMMRLSPIQAVPLLLLLLLLEYAIRYSPLVICIAFEISQNA